VSASGSVVQASLSGFVVTSRASTITQSQFSSTSPENLKFSLGAVRPVRSSVLPKRLYAWLSAPADMYIVPLNGLNGAAPGRSQSATLREDANCGNCAGGSTDDVTTNVAEWSWLPAPVSSNSHDIPS
jgi:hypothetical protein